MKQDAKKILKIASISIFFLVIIVYAVFRSHDLIFGVKIKNVILESGAPARTTVQSGGQVSDSIMHVTGNAKNAINLTINGREVSIDQSGNFNETIALLSGYNVIDIRAEDKFGSVDEENYKVIYKTQ